MTDILSRLRALADDGEEFREFTRRIVASDYKVLGVRTPAVQEASPAR